MSYLGHALMESRHGLVVDAETTLETGTARRETALALVKRTVVKRGATLGADKGYDVAGFVKDPQEMCVPPHVAQKKNSAIDARTTRHEGDKVSLRKRKLVEEIFGWCKTVGGLRKARFVGLAKVRAQTSATATAIVALCTSMPTNLLNCFMTCPPQLRL